MADWNPAQYLKFKAQRTQPAMDLAKRIMDRNPEKIIDIGCGPGNSTSVLKNLFFKADICGIDSSENMIERAKSAYPDIDFMLCDVRNISSGYDLIFSNACLQWLPDHKNLIPELMGKLNEGGVLAVQIPMNGEEPLFQIIKAVTEHPKWGFISTCFEANKTLPPHEYFDILSECSDNFNIWETVYYHNMPSHEALIEWVKSTRLKPYLEELDEESKETFLNEILEKVKKAYSITKSGEVILRFRRFFFTAIK